MPLTAGVVADIKKRRRKKLRDRVLLKKHSSIKIQALWRRALVTSALWDEHFDTWVRRWDVQKSDMPYYFNLKTKEIVWKKPLAYTYFGDLRGGGEELEE